MTKVAIACQGGGSQTAFTAGVLHRLFERNIHRQIEIVSLSGTSGGAVCATLVWEALKKQQDPPIGNLIKFWQANTANSTHEKLFNDMVVGQIRLTNKGILPKWQLSPSNPLSQLMFSLGTVGLRKDFVDFRSLLENHIDFEAICSWGPSREPPILVIGAANCIKGRFRKFTSLKDTIRVEHVMASAAVPTIFPAVEIDGEAYWDGLFSDNPPFDELTETGVVGCNIPDEIWLIKINPTGRDEVPESAEDIIDRRNEMIGNESLFQDIRHLEVINDFLVDGAFKVSFLDGKYHIKKPIKIPKLDAEAPSKSYHIPMIEMSEGLQDSLFYASKIDRSMENIETLIENGQRQADVFIERRFGSPSLG